MTLLHKMMNPLYIYMEKMVNFIPGIKFRIWHVYVCPKKRLADWRNASCSPVRLDSSEIRLLQHARPFAGQALEHRIAQENECWVIFDCGEIIYIQWVLANRQDTTVDLSKTSNAPKGAFLESKCIYLWDAWCAEAFRNRGINRKAKTKICDYYFTNLDMHSSLCIISPANTASRQSIGSIGFKPEKTIFTCSLASKGFSVSACSS